MADVRVPELPDYSGYGSISNVDELILYMVGANKTVRVPISALSSFLAASAATALSSPVLSLSVVADDEIDASWLAVTNATNYKLYRSETPSFNDADLIYTGSGLLFNDTGRTAATQYFYWLQATGSGYADSAYSNSTATTTGAGADITPPVYSSIEVSTTNPNQVKITYNETLQSVPSATTTQWSIPGKSCTFAAISGSVVTLTFNANFVPGETPLLTYTGNQVKDIAGNLAATFTNQAVVNALAVTAVRLSTPSNFKATPVSSTQVNLTWDNIANESSFKLERSEDGSTWTVKATPSADITSYNDTTAVAGTLYWYKLTAIGDGVNFTDSLSTSASATTPASSGAEYDTILTFTTSTQDTDAKVTGTAGATSALMQFQFTADTLITGLNQRMLIKEVVGGFAVPKLVIDFPDDYLGKPFKYINASGVVYTNNFQNNSITFP
jgi:hypothetical protein